MVRSAFDIGGTFTDFVVIDDENATVSTGKVPTQADRLADGVLDGLRRWVPDLDDIAFAVHGTTVGLNAFLQRRGGRPLLVVTRGMRDVYHIARGDRIPMYDTMWHKAKPLVPLADTMEVGGRLDYAGEVVEPISEEDVQRVAERLRGGDFDAVVVAFLFSYVNPEHEEQVERLLKEAVPDIAVSLSHRVAPEWQEYERTSSAVLDAYVGGPVRRYLRELEAQVAERGMNAPLHIMQSNGGILTAKGAGARPLQTLLSGPVGGVMGAAALAGDLQRRNVICADMGGTSFDVSLVIDGRPDVASEIELEQLPVLMSAVLIHTIGAGGGSIGYVEAGGLRVGPESAGAFPGPACYGRGGTRPTVTDANLMLRRVDPEYFVGGEMTLDDAAADEALRDLADELCMDVVQTAEGMLTVVNAKMAHAIRTLTIDKGIEPRDFSLLAYGGAGSMHAAFIAEELEIGEVIVPPSPGTFSAWGMLHAPLRHDLTRMLYIDGAELPSAGLEDAYRELETQGFEMLAAEGARPDSMTSRRSMGIRYLGQEHTVEVSLDGVDLDGEVAVGAVGERFHAAHHARYGHSTPSEPFECVVLRLSALGEVTTGDRRAQTLVDGRGTVAATSVERTRTVIFDGKPTETAILMRAELAPGTELDGPAIVEEPTATTVVPPSFRLRIEPSGALVLTARGR